MTTEDKPTIELAQSLGTYAFTLKKAAKDLPGAERDKVLKLALDIMVASMIILRAAESATDGAAP